MIPKACSAVPGPLPTTLLGLIAGRWLRAGSLGALAGLALALLGAGLLLAPVLPFNKNLWTPSYVLWSGGLSIAALLLAHLLIDRKGWPAIGRRFGVNAIAAYLGSSVMALVLISSGAWTACYALLSGALPASPKLASLLCAAGFVAFWWGVAWLLDRRRVYLKI
jgi:predicted acyltransferase